jgi:hypothetical protein
VGFRPASNSSRSPDCSKPLNEIRRLIAAAKG